MTILISPESISPVIYQNFLVLTTELLAQLYGTEVNNIQVNHTRNRTRFIEGKHFFKISGVELMEFKYRLTESKSVAKNARSLILWTERGAARHAKMLETDQAWEVFEKLEDCYFRTKQPIVPAKVMPVRQKRVVTTFENDMPVNHYSLHDNEIIASLDSFLDVAIRAGFVVFRPEELMEVLTKNCLENFR